MQHASHKNVQVTFLFDQFSVCVICLFVECTRGDFARPEAGLFKGTREPFLQRVKLPWDGGKCETI